MKSPLHLARLALKRQAWIAVTLFALATFGVWVSFRSIGAALGENTSPTRGELLLTLGLIVGGLTWQLLRHPQADVRSWVKLRILWNRRDWLGLFGFSCTLLLFGVVLGIVCSTGKWWQLPPAQAAQYSLIFAAVGGLLGFFGGLAIHLPGASGWPAPRRAA